MHIMFIQYSKIGCRRTHIFRGQARCSYLQAAFLPRSLTSYIADVSRPKSHKNIMFLVQAWTFLGFQAGRSSATRSSAYDLTVVKKGFYLRSIFMTLSFISSFFVSHAFLFPFSLSFILFLCLLT